MTKNKSKGPKFLKPSGVGTPTLIRKKGESDDDFIARMKSLGYDLEKVGFHWMPSSDSTRKSNLIHPGELGKCKRCGKPIIPKSSSDVKKDTATAEVKKADVTKIDVKPSTDVITTVSEKIPDKIGVDVKSENVKGDVKPDNVPLLSKDEEKKAKKEKKKK